MKGYRRDEQSKKIDERFIAKFEASLIDLDEQDEEYKRQGGNEIGFGMVAGTRELTVDHYIRTLDDRYDLRRIIAEMKKRPEYANYFDDPEEKRRNIRRKAP